MLTLEPIGYFSTESLYRYDVPRQGVVAGENQGIIELLPGKNYEEALSDLAGFSHIWVVYWFHKNTQWKPKILPPRHVDRKVGLFASRSPYRPNPVGISAVRLEKVCGLKLFITRHDLLDGTPILDIKPYLPYADAFPEASLGWTGEDGGMSADVRFADLAEEQLSWLEAHGVACIRQFIRAQLEYEPLNGRRHRLVKSGEATGLAYRTWRVWFSVSGEKVLIEHITTGYTLEELTSLADRYNDKETHRAYASQWPMEVKE